MNSIRLGLALIIIVAIGLSLAYTILDPAAQACDALRDSDPGVVCARYTELVLVLTLVASAVVTLFGSLALYGNQGQDDGFSEPQIRFAIAMTILVLYLVYFCMAVFWEDQNSQLVETLTNLMMVVIPFYFGASAVAQVAKKKE